MIPKMEKSGDGKYNAAAIHERLRKKSITLALFTFISFILILTVNSFMSNNREIVFAGNSLTAFFPFSELFPGKTIKNFGVPGEITDGLIARTDSFVKNKPEKIFIEIGINNLHQGDSVDHVLNDCRELIRQIKSKSPESEIYVQSLLPTALKNETAQAIIQPKIILMNRLLKQLCANEHVHYIHLFPYFAKNGKLKKEFDIGDGLHLTAKAYIEWKKRIQRYLK